MSITNLVLIGRTGNGKSATGNTILGRRKFLSKMSSKSVTKECDHDVCEWKDGRIIRVIDTPGLFDTNAKRGVIEKEIVRCIDIAQAGVHGFILVLSVRNRFTAEEANAIEKVQVLFGPKILDYVTIVFTGADLLNDDGYFSLKDYLEDTTSDLKKLLWKLNSRVVEFDNITTNKGIKESQVSKLLEIVDKNLAFNGGSPYTNELFELAQTMTSQVYYIQDKEQSYREQIEQMREMMDKNMHAMKKKMEEDIKRIQEQAKSANNDVVSKLMKELSEARRQLNHIKEIEQGKCCGCSIM